MVRKICNSVTNATVTRPDISLTKVASAHSQTWEFLQPIWQFNHFLNTDNVIENNIQMKPTSASMNLALVVQRGRLQVVNDKLFVFIAFIIQ